MHEDVGVIARRPSVLVCLAAAVLGVAACSGDDGEDARDDAATGSAVTLPGELPVVPEARPFELAVPLCDDLPDPADSLDWSGAQFSEVAFPTRTRDALILALEFPYVADVWGGTGIREGWIVIGVTGGAVELQAMLDGSYPGARVLAMPLDWTVTELEVLAAEVDLATDDLQLAVPGGRLDEPWPGAGAARHDHRGPRRHARRVRRPAGVHRRRVRLIGCTPCGRAHAWFETGQPKRVGGCHTPRADWPACPPISQSMPALS